MIPRYGEWNQRLGPRGLTVLGVHAPETSFERDRGHLAAYVAEHHISWPVLVDGDFALWSRYRVQAWPTIVLIDKKGLVRAVHVGDDSGPAIEADLKRLLDED